MYWRSGESTNVKGLQGFNTRDRERVHVREGNAEAGNGLSKKAVRLPCIGECRCIREDYTKTTGGEIESATVKICLIKPKKGVTQRRKFYIEKEVKKWSTFRAF